jgi:lipopolysaccharide/colanic/teichoic acid biosynthesis glycosyltransferase
MKPDRSPSPPKARLAAEGRYTDRDLLALDTSTATASAKKSHGQAYKIEKRVLDLLLSSLALLVATPVMLSIAILIKITSKGPVLIRSDSKSQDDTPFHALSFRTMYVDCDCANTTDSLDKPSTEFTNGADRPPLNSRLTPLGRSLRKLGLEKLPLLLNVLCGDMSLVGPPPALPFEILGFTPSEIGRLAGKPGITSAGRAFGTREDKRSLQDLLDYDLEYAAKASIITDIKILFTTVLCGLKSGPHDEDRPAIVHRAAATHRR